MQIHFVSVVQRIGYNATNVGMGVRFSPEAPVLPSVAQPGSASGLGPEGREFEPLHSDQNSPLHTGYNRTSCMQSTDPGEKGVLHPCSHLIDTSVPYFSKSR